MRFQRSRLVALMLVLSGCAGLFGSSYATVEEDADGGLSDAGATTTVDAPSSDGAPLDAGDPPGEASVPTDSGSDSATCDTTKLLDDGLNCGRCGHSCLGGACTNGVCDATMLGVHTARGFLFLAQHGDYLYASTFWRSFAPDRGIYRIPKTGGPPELYFAQRNVEQIHVEGDTLYFIVNESPFNDASSNMGGVWSCDLTKPGMCVPRIEAIANYPNALTGDNGALYFHNFSIGSDTTIRSHAIDAGDVDASAVIGRASGIGYLFYLHSRLGELHSLQTVFTANNERAYLSVHPTDGGGAAGEGLELSRYTNPHATAGGVTGTASAVFYAAFDLTVTTGGVIRRHPRAGAPPADTQCSYSNGAERRPGGVFSDDVNVYWTNQGDFAPPYGNGSIAWCPAHGPCCTQPNVIWRGAGEPVAITADDSYLYWITYQSSEVFRATKP